MKGTTWNGSHFANKGTSRSSGEAMFSVGGLVVFRYTHYCSPDGNSHSLGCCPSTKDYLLQEDILLEEYDNTTSDRYGSGDYDVRKIIELPELFWHEYSTERFYKTFLLQIMETSENVFLDGFIPGDIAEVRNHPGKFLHIYEIPRGYRKCKGKSFIQTVEAINLQKMQEDEGSQIISRAAAGEVVDPQILKGAYINASQWVTTASEYLSLAEKAGLEIAIAVAKANGHQEKQATLQSWKDAGVTDEDLQNHNCIKSNYDYNHHYYIKRSGWREGVHIAGESYGLECVRTLSLCSLSPERIQQHIAVEAEAERLRKEDRKVRFEKFSKTITERYGEEILTLALRKGRQKKAILAFLRAVAESPFDDKAEMVKVINISDTVSVLKNLVQFINIGLDPFKAAKVAERAYAWTYLRNAFPGVPFMGYFDDASNALSIYSENWGYKKSRSSFTLGDLESLQKLKEKLA